MRLWDEVGYLQAGGPGSGCHGDSCGRPSSGLQSVHSAINDWASADQDPTALNSIMQDVLDGKNTPETLALKDLAKQAQSDLEHLGSTAISLYRVELGTGGPRQDSLLRSYALTPGAAKAYLSGYEESYGHKLPKAVISRHWVSRDHVVAYYKQSDGFIPSEKEVIVSKKPFSL